MKAWLPALLFLAMMPAAFPSSCPGCEEIASAPPTGIFVLVHDSEAANRSLELVAYYENESASPRRQPLNDTILIIEVSNASGQLDLRKTYTDDNGTAWFSFSGLDKSCLSFKVLYCPYCVPPESNCSGFRQCLNLSRIQSDATDASGIQDAADARAPDTLNPSIYLPDIATASWCPPPEPMHATPEFCLPLILIFSVLCGALYLTGKNPFSGFNIGGVRPGQHLRYQARARGWSLNVTQMASTAVSLGQSIGTLAESPEKFAQQEASAIESRATMGMSRVHTTIQDRKKGGVADKAAKAGGKEAGKKAAQSGGSAAVLAGGPKGGVQAGGGGYAGRQVVGRLGESGLASAEGVKALPEAIGRLALFVVMSSSIGRVVDSAISAGTGKGLLSLVSEKLEGRAMELEEAKSQRAAMDGHVPSTDSEGNDRIVDVKREIAIKDNDGKPAGREIIYADRSGKSSDGEMRVRYDAQGNVEWTQLNMLSADGKVETYRISSIGDGKHEVSKMDPATGAPALHLYGAEAEKIALAATSNQISDLTRPGASAKDFLEVDYAIFKEAKADVDRKIASMESDALRDANNSLNGQIDKNKEDKDAMDALRDKYAADTLAAAMGVDEAAARGMAFGARPADVLSTVSEAMEKAGLTPGTEVTVDKVNAYKEAIGASDLPDFAKGAVIGIGVGDRLKDMYEAGKMMQPEHTGDLLSKPPAMEFMRDPSQFGPQYADTKFSNEFKIDSIQYERSLEVQSYASQGANPAYKPEPVSESQKAAASLGLAHLPGYDGTKAEDRDFSRENDEFQARVRHEADAAVAKIAFSALPAEKFPKESQNEVIDALLSRDRERLKAAFGGKD